MSEHRYEQYCALARTLDVVGDRWTLLIIRELRPGPRRFTDLVDGLPGISRKLLAERLRDLERDGIVTRRQLPPPVARQVYELTDDGRDLAIAMSPVVAWGLRRLGELTADQAFQPRWAAVGMASAANREAAKGISQTYQYIVGDVAFHFVVDDGSIEVRDGHAQDADVVVTTDEKTWASVAAGKTRASAAISAGALTIVGELEAVERLRQIFSLKHIFGTRIPEGADR
jgi:DNA-binding HxlR family transcriptional regulator/putative sterol carrier protein